MHLDQACYSTQKYQQENQLIRITPGLASDVERFSYNVIKPTGTIEYCPYRNYEVECNLLITITNNNSEICEIWLIPNETTNFMVLLNSDTEDYEEIIMVGSTHTYYLPYDYQTYTLRELQDVMARMLKR